MQGRRKLPPDPIPPVVKPPQLPAALVRERLGENAEVLIEEALKLATDCRLDRNGRPVVSAAQRLQSWELLHQLGWGRAAAQKQTPDEVLVTKTVCAHCGRDPTGSGQGKPPWRETRDKLLKILAEIGAEPPRWLIDETAKPEASIRFCLVVGCDCEGLSALPGHGPAGVLTRDQLALSLRVLVKAHEPALRGILDDQERQRVLAELVLGNPSASFSNLGTLADHIVKDPALRLELLRRLPPSEIAAACQARAGGGHLEILPAPVRALPPPGRNGRDVLDV